MERWEQRGYGKGGAQEAQGPPQISAGRAGAHGLWEERRGIFPASFPACVGVASHHGAGVLLRLSVLQHEWCAPTPEGVPAVLQAVGDRSYLEELQS